MFCNFALQKYGKEQQQALAPPLSLIADNCNQLQGDIQTDYLCTAHRLRCFLKILKSETGSANLLHLITDT